MKVSRGQFCSQRGQRPIFLVTLLCEFNLHKFEFFQQGPDHMTPPPPSMTSLYLKVVCFKIFSKYYRFFSFLREKGKMAIRISNIQVLMIYEQVYTFVSNYTYIRHTISGVPQLKMLVDYNCHRSLSLSYMVISSYIVY